MAADPAGPRLARVPEGLSAAEVGKEIAEHRGTRPSTTPPPGTGAGSRSSRPCCCPSSRSSPPTPGYCAAKWGTEASVTLAKASASRTKANRADLEALQIRTLDSVSFNPAFAALPRTTRPRCGWPSGACARVPAAFQAWLAQHR